MHRSLHIAVIGAGFMGRTHAYAVQSLPFYYENLSYQAELTTICSRTLETAERFRQNFGFCRATDSISEVLSDHEIDIVDICTPNAEHFGLIQSAILAGKSVLCEKPLVGNEGQADAVRALLTGRRATYGTVFNNRYLPAVKRAAELVGDGRLGRLLSFRCAYQHSSGLEPGQNAGWKQTKQAGGGVLMDLGSHCIDLLQAMLNGTKDHRIARVWGKSQIAFPTRRGMDGQMWETDADEAFYLIAQLQNGATGTIEASKIISGANDDFTVELHGTDGSIRFDLMQPNFLYFYDARACGSPHGGERGYTAIECVGRYGEPCVFPGPKAPIGWLRGHIHGMYEYLDAVSRGVPAPCSFEDGLSVNDVIAAAFRSDRSGRFETV